MIQFLKHTEPSLIREIFQYLVKLDAETWSTLVTLFHDSDIISFPIRSNAVLWHLLPLLLLLHLTIADPHLQTRQTEGPRLFIMTAVLSSIAIIAYNRFLPLTLAKGVEYLRVLSILNLGKGNWLSIWPTRKWRIGCE